MRGFTAASARSRSVVIGLVAGVVVLVLLIGLVFWGALNLLGRDGDNVQPVEASSSSVSSPAVEASAVPSTSAASLLVADGTCTDPSLVDRSDADAVAVAVVEIAFCFDSVLDTNTNDALMRAEPLMTEKMRESVRQNQSSRNALSAQFLEASEQRGYTVTTVKPIGSDAHHASDGGVYSSSQYVKWTWVPRGGQGQMEGGYAVWTMNLVQDNAGQWAVDSFILGSFEPEF